MFKVDDFKSAQIATVTFKMVLSPATGITHLTDAQISKVLSGEVKNWKDVGGADLPISMLIPKSLVAGSNTVIPAIEKKFLAGGKMIEPLPESILDPKGILRAMQKHKGAFSFFTAGEKFDGLVPVYISTGITRGSYFFVKKDGPEPAQKLFNYFASNRIDPEAAWR